jgi:hypothetical protein
MAFTSALVAKPSATWSDDGAEENEHMKIMVSMCRTLLVCSRSAVRVCKQVLRSSKRSAQRLTQWHPQTLARCLLTRAPTMNPACGPSWETSPLPNFSFVCPFFPMHVPPLLHQIAGFTPAVVRPALPPHRAFPNFSIVCLSPAQPNVFEHTLFGVSLFTRRNIRGVARGADLIGERTTTSDITTSCLEHPLFSFPLPWQKTALSGLEP